ncbi:hypothetical protein BJV82DRAFT_672419 [Fennellomyces sp. T-0311]|nr:hypothetical protein BJV82DRAFT_672419 [Fennellomyces sp. T-0311]
MAIFLPVVLVGAPIGYFTWSTVFNEADYQAAKICHGDVSTSQQKSKINDPNYDLFIFWLNSFFSAGVRQLLREDYPARSGFAATVGTVGSFGLLSRSMFGKNTRHRLFFAHAPPGADIRWVTAKMAGELLLRCGVIVYGAAVGGAVAGRLAVAGKPLPPSDTNQ